jgi:hypothetical protein
MFEHMIEGPGDLMCGGDNGLLGSEPRLPRNSQDEMLH